MNSNYLLKLWLSTIVAAPVLIIPATFIFNSDLQFDPGITDLYFSLVFYGLIFSIPAVFAITTLSYFLKKRLSNPVALKRYNIRASLVTMTFTFMLVFGAVSTDFKEYGRGLILTVLYGITILLFGRFYTISK